MSLTALPEEVSSGASRGGSTCSLHARNTEVCTGLHIGMNPRHDCRLVGLVHLSTDMQLYAVAVARQFRAMYRHHQKGEGVQFELVVV